MSLGGDGVGLEVGEIDELEGREVGRLQDDRAGLAGLERLGPTGRADAPLVAGPEAGHLRVLDFVELVADSLAES